MVYCTRRLTELCRRLEASCSSVTVCGRSCKIGNLACPKQTVQIARFVAAEILGPGDRVGRVFERVSQVSVHPIGFEASDLESYGRSGSLAPSLSPSMLS
jgi:hypothetical protein